MSSFSKYTLVIITAFIIIFIITMFTTMSVRDVGGLSPLDDEYAPVTNDPQDEEESSGNGNETETEETTSAEDLSGVPKNNTTSSNKPSRRVTVRSFLVDDQVEGEGYGLYSYLLFTAPPNTHTREKYTALLTAFLQKVSTAASVEKYIKRKYLNVTYVPIKRKPPNNFSEWPVSRKVAWIFRNYNYDRARVLLAFITDESSGGPFIYSRQNPLYLQSEEIAHTILQDMAQAPAHLCGLWLDKFINQAAKEKFWEEDRLFAFTVNLRTAIASLGTGIESVSRSMDWWQEKMDQWIRIEKVARL